MTGRPLAGTRALVTGASRGIGAAISLDLAKNGADIVATSRSIHTASDELRDATEAEGRSFVGIACDLAERGQVDDLIATALALPGGIDILVCNAGMAERAPAEVHRDGQWDAAIEVNLTSQFRLARELGAAMLQRRRGKIIFIASMMSFQGGRDVVGYAAAKSAVTGVVHALANEWAPRGVNVNAVAPGYVETDLTTASHGDAGRRAAIEHRIPAGRWAVPADIAGPVVFLASPASDYVHGVVLPVDGGWLVR